MKKIAFCGVVIIAFGLISASTVTVHGEQIGGLTVSKPTTIAIDHKNKSITFAGVVMAEKWQAYVHPVERYAEKGFDPDHWHLIISGTQANPSIGRVPVFAAWATDIEVSEALAVIGAKVEKGEFGVKSYEERLKKDSPYPDYKPKGTPISVYITWNDKSGKEKTVEVNEFLENSTGKKLEFVYVGKIHPSHCIACLYACPGGKIANSSLSVRDYFDRGAVWKIKSGILPPDGTPVLITFMIKS
jgi:hypothetical protein